MCARGKEKHMFMRVHNERESQDTYLCVCARACVRFNSSVNLRTPQWHHLHPPDTCLTGYNVTIIRTWLQNNLPMSPQREPGTLLTQPPELTPAFTYKQYASYPLSPCCDCCSQPKKGTVVPLNKRFTCTSLPSSTLPCVAPSRHNHLGPSRRKNGAKQIYSADTE